MRKIGFLISAGGWGGLEMNVLNLAKWLRDRNWEIVIYAAPGIKVASKAIEMGFPVVSLRHWKYLDIFSANHFSQLLKQSSIHNLFAFDNKDLDFIFLTKTFFFKELRVIYQQHMQIGIDKSDWLHTLRYSVIDCWISPLKFLKQEVFEKTRFNPFKIKVIPLGVEIDKLYPATVSKPQAQEHLDLITDRKILGILGRIDPKKGQLFLVKAVHSLVKKNVPVDLLILGEPTINNFEAEKYFKEIKQFIHDNNLDQHVKMRPASNDVQPFYQAIDIFVLASAAETYGMVTIEAMLSGTPILATNGGGTSEILGEGKFGCLYKHNDEEEFCEKIQWILNNPEKVKQMTQKAIQHAAKKFAHERECEEIEKILLEDLSI